MPLNEHQIQRLIDEKAPDAVGKLYEAYCDELCRYAFRFFPSEAEEIVHDVFLKLVEKPELLNDVFPYKPYLYRAVHNACVNKIEHEKVKEKHANHVAFELKMIELEDEVAVDYSIDAKVEKAIDELPEKSKEIMAMKYYKGMKTGEIAEKMDVSKKTVDTHVFRSIKKLRDLLRDYLP